jgi:hypothetical protein
MPKRTYGETTRRRTLQVLETILRVANLEREHLPDSNIEFRWVEYAAPPKLVVKATVADLWQACSQGSQQPQLTKAAVREALHALEKHLGILTDNRTSTQGAATWHFTLDLWSRDPETNLAKALKLWQSKQDQRQASTSRPLSLKSRKNSGQVASSLDDSDLSQMLDDYARWYRQTYGVIKILPGLMQRPIPLEAVYVDVKVLDQQSKRLLSPNALETFCQKFQSRSLFGNELPRRDGLAVAQECPYLMVLGSPGMGKSTFLKKLGLHALAAPSSATSKQLPILIELKRLQQSPFNLQNTIQQILFRRECPNSTIYVEQCLYEGSFLLLLDGLDEVPEAQRGELVQHIQIFIQNFPKNKIIISCRTAAHYFNFTQFVDVIVAEFSDAQIRSFLDNWFNSKAGSSVEQAITIWSLIKQRKNAPLKELARTPLLLTYICLVFESEEAFPATRNLLYDQVLNLFLRDWTQQKSISLAEPSRLPLYLQKQLLSEIAYETFKDEQLFIPPIYLRQKILEFSNDHAPANSKIDPDIFLRHLVTRQGLLAERFKDCWSFSHLTLQEYLVAHYIVNNAQIDFLLNECLTSRRWREVVISTAECLDIEAYNYLTAIQDQANKIIIDHPKLKDIISWSQNSFRDSSSAFLTLSERASLIAAFSAIAASRASDFDIDNSVGYKIAFALVTGCASAVAIAQEGSALYQAAVTSSATIAAARANAADEARANNIDFVIREARELIDDVSNESGILSEYDRTRIVCRGIGFSSQAANAGKRSSSSFSGMLTELDDQLTFALNSVPDATADASTWLGWSAQLEASWIQAFRCSKDLMTLTLAEAEAFETYLYLTELLIRCIESAWQIPESDRQSLKQQLLV